MMIDEKPKPKRKNFRIYGEFTPAMRFSLSLVWGFLILLLIGSIISFLAAFREPSIWGTISVILASFAIYGLCVWGIWRLYGMIFNNYIRVDEVGIEYYFCGVMGFAYWHDLASIGYRGDKQEGHVWGILTTRDTSYWQGYFAKNFARAQYFKDMIPLSLISTIRLPRKFKGQPHVDLAALKRTDFGRDLFYFAPQLFDDLDKQKNT